ncbi:hypothetical protein [Pseudogemmobacter sonorensis]|uniref:hypothetical protein n=1 Tax=Pseudogemmobacter sonorensis TaxID=2989681 RepID=UPI0036A85AF5
MNSFGDDLIQAMGEALAHAKSEGPAILHTPVDPHEVRTRAKLTQAQMAPLMGMSLSGYRKVGTRTATRFRTSCGSAAGNRAGTGGSSAGLGGLAEGLKRMASVHRAVSVN